MAGGPGLRGRWEMPIRRHRGVAFSNLRRMSRGKSGRLRPGPGTDILIEMEGFSKAHLGHYFDPRKEFISDSAYQIRKVPMYWVSIARQWHPAPCSTSTSRSKISI